MFTLQGTVLIAVNPLRRIPNPDMSEFMDRSLNPEAPHPYAIAEVRHLGHHFPLFPCEPVKVNAEVESIHLGDVQASLRDDRLSLKEPIGLGVC